MPFSRTAPQRRPASSPATWSLSIDGRPIESFSDMQRIVSTSAGETARRSRSIAAARSVDAQGDAGAAAR